MSQPDDAFLEGKLNQLRDTLVKAVAVGAEVDWSKYKVEPEIVHLYQRAVKKPTDQGLMWVTPVEEFKFLTGTYSPTKKSPSSLGMLVTQHVNSAFQWKIATVFPGQPGTGVVVLSRTVEIALPEPEKVEPEPEKPLIITPDNYPSEG